MQYLVIVYDYKDALEKRLSVREEHLKNAKELINNGKLVTAGALIEDDKMIGSTILTNFDTQKEFDKWLEDEVYVKSGVWDMQTIKVLPIKLIPKESSL